MNILIIFPEDIKGKRRGGVTTSSMVLAKYLVKLNNEVTVLSRANKNGCFSQDGYKVFRVADLKFKKSVFLKILFSGLDKGLKKIFPEFTGRIFWALQVFFFVKNYGPFDIIESPEWCNSTLFVSLFSKSKVIVKLHRGWYCYLKDNQLPISVDEWLVCILEFLSIIFASAVSSPSGFMLSYYKRILSIFHWDISKKTVEVIPYGIEIEKTQKPKFNGPKYLLFVGRIEKAKGCFVLIKAFEHIVKQHQDLKLLLIGEDTKMFDNKKLITYKGCLGSYIYRNHLEKRILFLPRKTAGQLKKYYSNCLFLIAPSVGRENFPMVLLEAVSFNKAVISSNTGGIPEIVKDRFNGLLFIPNDENDLAKKISLLLDNDKLRLRFERNNIKYKKKFDAGKISLQTLSFYRKIFRS
jgi:glycosyltransferase involved in cell wall biosynthesis